MARRALPLDDPYERGARRSYPGLEPLPAAPKRMRPITLALVLLGLALAFAVVQGGRATYPALPGSCTHPAVALSAPTTKAYGVLRWSAVGPSGSSVVLGLDTTGLPSTGAQPGRPGRVAGPTPLTGCGAHGLLSVPADLGDHGVTAYLVHADGAATLISTTRLAVTRR